MNRSKRRDRTTPEERNSDALRSAVAASCTVPPIEIPRNVDLPQRKKPKTIKIEQESETATKKKLRRVDFAAEEDDMILQDAGAIAVGLLEDVRPTSLRLTDKGGYLHTKQSRMKISQANQGKSPWNKGKERTDDAKAKISAGVKARNHILLLQKLQSLNMTEQEWYAKKKQIKLLRERVRKAKISATKFEQEQMELKLKKEKSEAGNSEATLPLDADPGVASLKQNVAQGSTAKRKSAHTQAAPDSFNNLGKEVPEPQIPPQPYKNTIPTFRPELKWTPHVLDTPNLSYEMLCPHGGPGGLICCHSCMVQYSKYLTSTFQDIERQATEKVGNELQELLNDTCAAKLNLAQTLKVARRKPIPIRQYHAATSQAIIHSRDTATALKTDRLDAPAAAQPPEDDTAFTLNLDPILDFPDIMLKEEV